MAHMFWFMLTVPLSVICNDKDDDLHDFGIFLYMFYLYL